MKTTKSYLVALDLPQPDTAKPEISEPMSFSKRSERTFALRKYLVYHDPRQWDKDITTGTGEE